VLSGNYHFDPTASPAQVGEPGYDWDEVGPPGHTSGSITYTVPGVALTSSVANPTGATSFRVCAWLEQLPPPGGASTGPVSAGPASARLALTGVTLARPGPPTIYSGSNGRGRSLALLVEGNQVRKIRWQQTFSCPSQVELVSGNSQIHERWNGTFTYDNDVENVLIGAGGRFTVSAPGDNYRPGFTVSGTQHGETIGATFHAEFKPGPPDYKAAPGTVCRAGPTRLVLKAGR
jgi:hypothetical protein